MDSLDVQGLAGGTDSAAQRLVLPDLDIQRCLRRDGGLSRLGGFFLQIYVATRGQESSANQDKKSKWSEEHGSAELTLGLALPG